MTIKLKNPEHAPALLAQRSSFSHYDISHYHISHYDISHFPNGLMAPSINAARDADVRLDLTPALCQDEGWRTNEVTHGSAPATPWRRCGTAVAG